MILSQHFSTLWWLFCCRHDWERSSQLNSVAWLFLLRVGCETMGNLSATKCNPLGDRPKVSKKSAHWCNFAFSYVWQQMFHASSQPAFSSRQLFEWQCWQKLVNRCLVWSSKVSTLRWLLAGRQQWGKCHHFFTLCAIKEGCLVCSASHHISADSARQFSSLQNWLQGWQPQTHQARLSFPCTPSLAHPLLERQVGVLMTPSAARIVCTSKQVSVKNFRCWGDTKTLAAGGDLDFFFPWSRLGNIALACNALKNIHSNYFVTTSTTFRIVLSQGWNIAQLDPQWPKLSFMFSPCRSQSFHDSWLIEVCPSYQITTILQVFFQISFDQHWCFQSFWQNDNHPWEFLSMSTCVSQWSKHIGAEWKFEEWVTSTEHQTRNILIAETEAHHCKKKQSSAWS